MIIFDVEIQNAITKSGEKRLDGINYCAGFSDFPNMGVACVCAYDYVADSYHVFGDCELDDFAALVKTADVVVGYNNLAFDNPLLAANDCPIPDSRSYDLHAEITRSLGHRISLANIAEINKLGGKNGDGALAPVLWQRGEHTRVINYCLNDVRLTKRLLDKVIRQGWLHAPDNKTIRIRKPGI